MKPDNSMTEDEDYMRAALELARQGWDAGEVPVGALVVCGGEIIAAHSSASTPSVISQW